MSLCMSLFSAPHAFWNGVILKAVVRISHWNFKWVFKIEDDGGIGGSDGPLRKGVTYLLLPLVLSSTAHWITCQLYSEAQCRHPSPGVSLWPWKQLETPCTAIHCTALHCTAQQALHCAKPSPRLRVSFLLTYFQTKIITDTSLLGIFCLYGF